MMMTCEWTLNDEDYNIWVTGCGQDFSLEEDTPHANNMSYCCFCGCKLVVVEEENCKC